MKLRTFLSLLFSGQIKVMRSLSRAAHDYHRVAFLGGGLSNGVLRRLVDGPVSLDTLAAELGVPSARHDALRAWLQIGVALGELSVFPTGYALRGRLSRMLVDPRNDAAAAFVEEMAYLHNTLSGS